MATSYSTPPQFPELDTSAGNPFFPTMLSYGVVTDVTLPRDVVKNWVPRIGSGLGCSTGQTPAIQANLFPFNASADGLHANDYVWRSFPNCKAINIPYGIGQAASSHPYGTIAWVFKVEDVYTPNPTSVSQFAPIIGLGQAVLYNGQLSQAGGPGAVNPLTVFGVHSTGAGLYLGYLSSQGVPGTQTHLYLASCPIVIGHWYAAAVACSDYNATLSGASVSLNHAMRFYLHDLTTATRISSTGASDEVYTSPEGFGSQTNVAFANTPFGWDSAWALNRVDLTLFPGRQAQGAVAAVQLKCWMADFAFWDDSSSRWQVLPAGFSGTDQFTTFVNNIYVPVAAGTYTTGAVTTIINSGANQTSSINSGKITTYASMTSSATGPAGTASNAQVVALGDVAVTRVDNTTVSVMVTRPQAAPNAPTSSWVWKLYASTTRQTGATGSPVITQTQKLPNFIWTVPTSAVYFLTVTAYDGTNTYTYAETPCALNPYADVNIVIAGNSINTPTGRDPGGYLALAMNAYGRNCNMIGMAQDGSLSIQWTPSGAAVDVPSWYAGGTNMYTVLADRLLAESTYLPAGQKFDVFFQLIGNDAPCNSTIQGYWSAIATALLALSYVGRVIFVATPWQLSGHTEIDNSSAVSDSLALQDAIANGSTIFSIGHQQAKWSLNLLSDISGSHPNFYLATLGGVQTANEYQAILAPVSCGPAAILMSM